MRECFGVPSPNTFGLCAEASFAGGTTGAHPRPRDLWRTWMGRSQSSGSCTTMARPSWNTSTASECGNASSSSSSSSGTSGLSGLSAGSGSSRAASYREAFPSLLQPAPAFQRVRSDCATPPAKQFGHWCTARLQCPMRRARHGVGWERTDSRRLAGWAGHMRGAGGAGVTSSLSGRLWYNSVGSVVVQLQSDCSSGLLIRSPALPSLRPRHLPLSTALLTM